jgi:hypothetical protein
MSERVLCDEGLRVALEKVAGRLLFTVGNGEPTSFLTAPAVLADVLNGSPLQLSSPDGYCHLEPKGDRLYLTYGLQNSGRKTCSIALRDFAEALSWANTPADHG